MRAYSFGVRGSSLTKKRHWIDNVIQWTGKGLVDIVRLAESRDMDRRFVSGAAYARLPATAQ